MKSSRRQTGMTYADAGVHFATHNKLVTEIFRRVTSTYGPRVIHVEDGFGGLFSAQSGADMPKQPVLVACTDSAGTKVKLAFEMDKHDTVGIDCVAMSVNDMLCMGARPLFFLDYIGVGRKDLRVLLPLVGGVVEGCKQADCALIGGETAELPGLYKIGEYDIAGFGVGVVDKSRVLKGEDIRPGDVILGLESSGVHSNGYSLVRRIIKKKKWKLGKHVAEFGRTLGEELLTPTLIYVRPVVSALQSCARGAIAGIANITGGGLVENIPRILPANCEAVIDMAAWQPSAVFQMLQKGGNVSISEMYHVFNMGIGMVLICPPKHVDAVASHVQKFRHKHAPRIKARVIGEIRKGKQRVVLA